MKIPCCHNTLIMPGCFAMWWVEEEVSGAGGRGSGGGGGTQINYKVNIFHLDSIYPLSGPVHKYPDIF